MQIIAIAVLLIIAGLIGALLACATSLINRVRAANITLRRIEEALLSLNRAKAIDSAIKSAEPVKQSQPADAGSVGFRTLRELKTMSSRDRQSAGSAPIPNGRTQLRTRVAANSNTYLQGAMGREGTLAVHSATVTAHGAVVAALKTEATGQASAAVADRDPRFGTADDASTQEMLKPLAKPNGLDSGFEISCPRPDRQIPNLDLRKGIDEAVVHESQMVVTAVAQKVPTANDELPVQKASEVVEEAARAISPTIREMFPEVSTSNGFALREPEEAPTVESAVGHEVPEVGQGRQTAPTRTALDEAQEEKKRQQALMIISRRRRRARAGH
jgi:hypothetical protein